MNEEGLDLSELDGIVGPTDEQLKNITELAKRQLAAERTVAAASGSLDEAKRNLRRINENLLPEAMTEIGMEQFKLSEGIEIKINEALRASISEANRPAAYDWLREHGHDAIIKKTVTITFDPGQEQNYDSVVKFLEDNDIEFDGRSSIHARTLTAWVGNQLREGNPVPDEISHYEQRISKVKVN